MTGLSVMRSALFAVLLAGGVRQASGQQVIWLKNGDRLSGRIARIAGGAWVLAYGGAELRLPAPRIANVVWDSLLGVRLADGTIGAASATEAPGDSVRLAFADGTARLVRVAEIEAVGPADDLEALRPQRIGRFWPIWRFWRATGGAGFSDKSGNSRARGFSLSLDLERKTAKDRVSAGATLNREATQPAGGAFETTVEKYFASLRADVYLSSALFVFAQTQQERDRFQDLALRSTYTTGLGLQPVSTQRTDFRLWSSAGYQRQAFVANGGDHAAVGVLGYALSRNLGPARAAWRVEGTANLEDLGDARFRSEATLTVAVRGGLGVRVGAVNEFNNRPRPGVRKHDMAVTTALTYSLGR